MSINNLTKGSAKVLKSRAKNREGYNSYMRSWRKTKYAELKRKVFDILGHECVRCGFSDKRALQVDHIHSDGHKDRKNKGSVGYLQNILNNPERFQMLCANCNYIKRYENNEVVGEAII